MPAFEQRSKKLSTRVEFRRVRSHFSVRWRHPTIFILTMHMYYHTINIQSESQTLGSWAKLVVTVVPSNHDEKLKIEHKNRLSVCAFAFLGAMEASDHLYIDNALVISYNRQSEQLSDVGKLGKISCDRSTERSNGEANIEGIIVFLQHVIQLTRCYPINRTLCAFAFLGAMEASDHLYIDNAHVISYNQHSEQFSCDGKLGKISCDR